MFLINFGIVFSLINNGKVFIIVFVCMRPYLSFYFERTFPGLIDYLRITKRKKCILQFSLKNVFKKNVIKVLSMKLERLCAVCQVGVLLL